MIASGAGRVRAIARVVVQRYGNRGLKTWLWDRDFSRGLYGCHGSGGDFLYPYLEKYACGGRILDLGCGPGNTGSELRADAYAEYVGVDVSRVAIAGAAARAERDGRAGMNQYLCADILSYVPSRQFDVILWRDSIYYLSRARIQPTLDRYADFLTPDGVFIARICDEMQSYKWVEEEIEGRFVVVEKYVSEHPSAFLLVFRAQDRRA